MRVIISGGGTGGHVYPAIAIANELKRQITSIDILFVGAKGRLEMEKVPLAGYPIKGLWISGFQRKWSSKNVLFPLKLGYSLWRSYRIIQKFKPDVVVGVGGYASGPILKLATSLKIPGLIQEQNSYPGITNRLLAKHVQKICVAFDKMDRYFPASKIVFTGNPVRRDLLALDSKRKEGLEYFRLSPKKKTILVFGGSLGAGTLNKAIVKHERFFEGRSDLQIIWQIGKMYWEKFSKTKVSKLPNIYAMPYIDKMDLAYAVADLVVCRAGALTISELCIAGKAAVFVPSPNVAEDHQTKNAMSLIADDAALMVDDAKIEEDFERVVSELIENPKRIKTLEKNIKNRAMPNAVERIVKEIIQLL